MTVEDLSKIMNYLLESGKGHYQVFIPADIKELDNKKIHVMSTSGIEEFNEDDTVVIW